MITTARTQCSELPFPPGRRICKWIDVSHLGASINEIRSARYPTDLTSRYEEHSISCGTQHSVACC